MPYMNIELLLAAMYFRFRYGFNVMEMKPIQSGPFKGALLHAKGSWPGHKSRLLGTYEKELWPVIEELERLNVRHVIDVGCAEGYYSCGIAYSNPSIHVTAFDLSTAARCCTYFASRSNGIANRLSVRRFFDINLYDGPSMGRELVFLDCEGFEATIVNPSTIQKFLDVALLIECHEMYVNGITDSLTDLLGHSHVVKRFDSQDRCVEDIPDEVSGGESLISDMNEERPYSMPWLWAIPKSWVTD